jgi:hypothetical protein
METRPRPDLARLLPTPLLHRPNAPLPGHLDTPGDAHRTDFLLEVARTAAPDPDAAGFGLAQALTIAARIAHTLRHDGAAEPHRLASDRSRTVLDDGR